ncbi:DUF4249 family protein [Marinoscillum sp.]|uniref:DUF4249 family protein n=1 Tax=Marinoscillum sp. TaxID=2024838 RepID=UPI003BAAE868
MKSNYILSIVAALSLFACETIVDVKVNETETYLVVDAWLTRGPGDHTIKLTTTQPYYDNQLPPVVTDASVRVMDSNGNSYDFIDQDNGEYIYNSPDTFGVAGETYYLQIDYDGHTYGASATLPRHVSIDSITYTYEPKSAFGPAYYYSQFYGLDPDGVGDAYWLKAWRNGKFLGEPEQIYLFFDASFSEGNGDGIPFIFPIRTFANPFLSDINGNFIPNYDVADTIAANNDGTFTINESKVEMSGDHLSVILDGEKNDGGVSRYPLDGEPYFQIDNNTIGKKADSLYLELHAISPEAWFFLTRLQQEANRPEGFGALFATPPANLPTNILVDDEEISVAGFFNFSNSSSLGQRLNEQSVRFDE